MKMGDLNKRDRTILFVRTESGTDYLTLKTDLQVPSVYTKVWAYNIIIN